VRRAAGFRGESKKRRAICISMMRTDDSRMWIRCVERKVVGWVDCVRERQGSGGKILVKATTHESGPCELFAAAATATAAGKEFRARDSTPAGRHA
jgi:hypothetical protein